MFSRSRLAQGAQRQSCAFDFCVVICINQKRDASNNGQNTPSNELGTNGIERRGFARRFVIALLIAHPQMMAESAELIS